ncbi:Helix-turn-helix domain-containing protein [Clostridium sp. DSM 8431]|uniref:helix-turn-helix domain-containing protein n=1 Tax=Clostridium sp. DSM 8431 TaxID=1761781 RepID=UPI0008E2BD63|nr:AraC family transcriptional regulator [Clostridium sp. DSM 8431]SFU53236.1 Helix-turn-helix domain-containing protein [Clostridium sp. DSM 8431]
MSAYNDFYIDVKRTLSAMQPLMVLAGDKYYKKSVMKNGISHFYRYKVSQKINKNVVVVPDGSIDILFSVNSENPKAVCYGSPLNLTDINYVPFVKENKEIFGVRFFPGSTAFPSQKKMADFTNKSVDLSSILEKDDDFNEEIRIFTTRYLEYYRKQVIKEKESNLYEFTLKEIINSKGKIKVDEISEKSGYSSRYINKLFNEYFGMSPKLFCKIVRFQNVLKAVTLDEKIIDIADSFGFCDQSHLGKEFKAFIGTSPKRLNEILKTEDYQKRLCIVE